MLVALAAPVRSQISIGAADGPRGGDSLSIYFLADSLFGEASLGPAAPGQTWNFSLPGWDAGFGGRDMLVVPRQQMPGAPEFAGATLALLERREMPEFGTEDETYTFLGVESDRLSELGSRVRLDVGAGPRREYQVVERNEGYRLPLPMSYGDRWSNAYRTLLYRTPSDTALPETPRLASIGHTVTTSEVDGWGTVATPHGAYRALRVHSTKVSTDSLFTDRGAYDGTIADTLETYDWYAQATGAYFPVVSVEVANGAIASVQMLRFTSKSALVANADEDEPGQRIYLGQGSPNPASSRVTIPYAVAGGGPVSMAIYDMLGNLVRQPLAAMLMEEGSVEVDLSDLPQGSYLCRLESEGRSVTTPIVVRR